MKIASNSTGQADENNPSGIEALPITDLAFHSRPVGYTVAHRHEHPVGGSLEPSSLPVVHCLQAVQIDPES
jgi:hypothetical protein